MKLYKKFIKMYAEHNKLNIFLSNENFIERMKSSLTFFSIFDKISLKNFFSKKYI